MNFDFMNCGITYDTSRFTDRNVVAKRILAKLKDDKKTLTAGIGNENFVTATVSGPKNSSYIMTFNPIITECGGWMKFQVAYGGAGSLVERLKKSVFNWYSTKVTVCSDMYTLTDMVVQVDNIITACMVADMILPKYCVVRYSDATGESISISAGSGVFTKYHGIEKDRANMCREIEIESLCNYLRSQLSGDDDHNPVRQFSNCLVKTVDENTTLMVNIEPDAVDCDVEMVVRADEQSITRVIASLEAMAQYGLWRKIYYTRMEGRGITYSIRTCCKDHACAIAKILAIDDDAWECFDVTGSDDVFHRD